MRLLEGIASSTSPADRRTPASSVEASGWSASAAGAAAFEHWPLPDGRRAFFLGDASDHADGAPRVMALVRDELRARSQWGADPGWLLARVNARLLAELPHRRLVTAFLGCLGSDGRLLWCSAGQGSVYVSRRSRDEYELLPVLAPPLGADPELRPETASTVRLRPGGRLVALSDGILDADNGAGRILGPRRVKTVLDSTAGVPLPKLVGLLRDVLSIWQGGAAAGDQSLLVAGLAE